MIPYGKQDISDSDVQAVVDILKSDYLTQGPKVPEFETLVAKYCSAEFAVAVNSATSALHVACLSLGAKKGDIVWTSPISFVASANCALYCGAEVDFVDIDTSTGNMCVTALETKLQIAKSKGQLPKIVIPVHLAGQSCDMARIHALSKQYGFYIIEDASHAIGGNYKGHKVGSCVYSDVTVFSFHPVKIITSAEGGMALTNNSYIARTMKKFRSHGITNSEEELQEISHGPWYYEQQALGYNYRMTELQAALGISQLARLDKFVKQRNYLAKQYNALLPKNVHHLTQNTNTESAYHLYIIHLDEKVSNSQKSLITTLRAHGIQAHLHYIPIHLQPYYQALGFKKGDFPNAEVYYSKAITLPLHPNLTQSEQLFITDTLRGLL